MAHFAKLDDNNCVLEVLVVNNRELLDENGQPSEARGVEFLTAWSGGHTRWKQTSYNTRGGVYYVPLAAQQVEADRPQIGPDQSLAFRGNYAAPGFVYDQENDVFYPPRPYASWTISAPDWTWRAPVAYPTDGKVYLWDEPTLSWQQVQAPPV